MRSTLRVLGAALLWCASWWGPAVHAQAPTSAAAPPVIATGEDAVSLAGHIRYWIDERGGATIEQVEAAGDNLPWQLRRPGQQDRVDGRALWLRFDVIASDSDHWFLELPATGLDRVQQFHRDASGQWVRQESGDSQPVATWPVPGRVPTFELLLDMRKVNRYWLRIESTRFDFAAPVVLYRDTALLTKREREQLLLGSYFGIATLIALAALVHGTVYRDRAFRAFGLYVILLAVGQVARVGLGSQFLWRDWAYWNDVTSALWPGVPTAAALWFVRVVTEPARLSRALDLGVWALVAALLGAVAVDILVGSRVSQTLVLVLTGLSLAAVLSMVVWGWIDGRDPDLKLVALGFLPVLVMAMFPLARGLGLIPTSPLTRWGLYFGAVLEMPILYYALHVRLMRRRESMVRAAALSRTDALTGLPHRRGMVERLETSVVRARSHKQQCALLAVHVSNLDAIAEEFGREYVEKALVVAASHLRRCIVEVDMAARVGEREFAVLLESPVTAAMATSRAQQIVASGLRQIEALPAALTLKFHVTVAMLPHNAMDGGTSLQWVLEGLHQITPDAKKLIKPLNF
jgi:diguanylate cyclase (GGDEF)-like protein